MCTIILAHRTVEGAPVLFAANRDEQLERPSEPPKLRADRGIPVVSPRDLKAGGTWLGVNAQGVLAAITNRFSRPTDPSRRSRGELVDRALEQATAAEAAEAIAALEARDYNPFHLLCVDEAEAHLLVGDGDETTHTQLDPGISVITEQSFGAGDDVRRERVLRACEALLEDGDFDEPHLMELLSQPAEGSMATTCIHLPEHGYGTRSSTLVRLGDEPLLMHAEGPPCEVDYRDCTELLNGLFTGALKR